MAAASWWESKRLTLFELVPKQELRFPGSHFILGTKEEDAPIVKAMRSAVRGGYPTKSEGAWLLIELFQQVHTNLPKRRVSRDMFWQDVAGKWQEVSDVDLLPVEVRDLVLAISLAERRWAGLKSPEPTTFLYMVRKVNDYLRDHEPDSDEAVELVAQRRAFRLVPRNVFWQPPRERIPWRDLTLPEPASAPEPAALPTPQSNNGDAVNPPHKPSKNSRRKKNWRIRRAIRAKELADSVVAEFENSDTVDADVDSEDMQVDTVEEDDLDGHGLDTEAENLKGSEASHLQRQHGPREHFRQRQPVLGGVWPQSRSSG